MEVRQTSNLPSTLADTSADSLVGLHGPSSNHHNGRSALFETLYSSYLKEKARD
jgi:hypothetical protein